MDNGPANFFAQIYDTTNDVWSEDRRLSGEVEVQHFDFDGYYDDAGVLQGTYLASSIERTEEIVNLEGTDYTFTNIPVQGITDLRLFDHSLVINLTVEDADLVVSPPWPAAGDDITAEVTVRNTGDFATTAFDVSLYIGPPDEGGLLVGTERVDGPFPASAEVTLSFDFTHPSRYGNLYASVDDNAEVTETDETDNTAIYPLLNTPPVAAIHATPLTGDVPLLVDFDTANSGDPDGDPVTFVWSFGDGSKNAHGSEVSHSFDAAGEYTTKLTVTDSKGATSTKTVTISAGVLPAAPQPVPDGHHIPGNPMTARKLGDDIEVTWDVSTCPGPDYDLYAGQLGDFSESTDGTCSLGPAGTATVTLPQGNYWWVIAGTNGTSISSLGRDSLGKERRIGGWGDHCFVRDQNTTAPCP